jgi:hypothetical protein
LLEVVVVLDAGDGGRCLPQAFEVGLSHCNVGNRMKRTKSNSIEKGE